MTALEKLIEREPRYLVVDQSAVTIDIQSSNYTEAKLDAVLMDISAGGAKLKSQQQLPHGNQIALQLVSNELQGRVNVDATVCWTQLGSRGEWIVGVSFQPKIPEFVLDQLAKAGVFDRRDERRQPVSISSTAAWQLTRGTEPVCIVDISPGGFCLLSPQPGKPGAHVMLKFAAEKGDATVTGRCLWQVEIEQGFTLGCEFCSKSDYTTLRRVQTLYDAQLTKERRGILQRLFKG